METKTCKVCNLIKGKSFFKIKGLICKECINHQARINYFQKQGKPIPIKRKKFNSDEERKSARKDYNRKRDKKLVNILADEYIKSMIRNHAKYHNIIPDLSEDNIIKIKKLMEKKKIEKELGFRQCNTCQKTFPLDDFIKRSSCIKCNNKRHYKKYKHLKVRPQGELKLKYNEKAKALYHKNKEKLNDVYIKRSIISSFSKSKIKNIKCNDIPQELIELKRKELTLKRKIENGNKKTN